VEVHTRDGLLGEKPASPNVAASASRTPFRVEVR
jgi:hypothetical protein